VENCGYKKKMHFQLTFFEVSNDDDDDDDDGDDESLFYKI
jgi:hypothetical protein